MSWYDCKDLGSVSIARSVTLQNPSAQIERIKKKYETIQKKISQMHQLKVHQSKYISKKRHLKKELGQRKF